MRRSLLWLVLAALLIATGASASDWYCSARFGGMSNYWLFPIWMDDSYVGEDWAYTPFFLRHTEGGIFDYRQFDIGLNKDPMFFEFGFGWTSSTWEYDDPDFDYTETEKLTWYTFCLAGLYRFVDPDPIALDGGLRFQLHKAMAEWEYTNAIEESFTHDIGGWSVGPVVRARWYFADGALALAPEMFFKYTSLTYEDTYDYEGESDTIEYNISQMDTEYSVALEFYF